MQDLLVEQNPGMHRYANPQGLAGLIDAIVERATLRTQVATEREAVLVTAGATGALGAVVGATVSPGDDVLVLAPYWPLITGIVRCFHGNPIVVPLLDTTLDAESVIEAYEAARTDRTTAIYISSPNNPSGKTLPESWISALCEWARRYDLWILSDEVYEDYVYEGQHSYARTRAPERTFSVHSFSKAFGMAGNRCGYVVGPQSVMMQLRKVSTHSFYSTPTASQLAALRALDGRGDSWVDQIRPQYRALGDDAAERIGVARPQGGTFLFVDVAEQLDERGLIGFLEDCADDGLFLAPGPSFGPYPTHVRICFTCAPPEIVREGARRLAIRMGRET
jgi:N-succinyldiaminopimelate aminotransferase